MKPTTRLGLLSGPALALVFTLVPSGAALAAGPYQFTTLTSPCRIVDTRSGLGGFKGKIVNSQTVKFPIRNPMPCNVPPSAAAIAVNITLADVPNTVGSGFIALFPGDQSWSGISNINFTPPGFIANGAIVPLATTHTLDLAALAAFADPSGNATTGGTNLILDVTGYFVPVGGLQFYSIVPCRVIDTSVGTGGFNGQLPNGGTGTLFTVKGATPCNIPVDAVAVAANATAVGTQDQGFLALFPGANAWPGVSNVNFFAGDTIGNGALIPLSAGASDLAVLAVAANPATVGVADFTLDVTGYFK